MSNTTKAIPGEFEARPPGYAGPNLNPKNVRLKIKKIGDGVYAFMSNKLPRNNSGVIVGTTGVLVIDAGITPEISQQIKHLVRRITDKPITYLVNTTYHGDHSFGNASFDKSVTIIAQEQAAAVMWDGAALDKEKELRGRNMFTGERASDRAVFDSIQHWRQPDILVKDFMQIDLGGRIVHLHYFGPGNGKADLVVYEPQTQTVWTGNLVGYPRTMPMLLESEPLEYTQTLLTMAQTLRVKHIVPGHGFMAKGDRALYELMSYLIDLHHDILDAKAKGLTIEEIYQQYPLTRKHQLPFIIRLRAGGLMRNLHRLNQLATYTHYRTYYFKT